MNTFEELDAFFADCETATLADIPPDFGRQQVESRAITAWFRVREGLLQLIESRLVPRFLVRNVYDVDTSLTAGGTINSALWDNARLGIEILLEFPYFRAAWKDKIRPVCVLMDRLCSP